jgi:hypothetical protein
MTDWLNAQVTYDRIRKGFRQDGLTSQEVEDRLEWAAQQLLGVSFKALESDLAFALHLEQAFLGNAHPHY